MSHAKIAPKILEIIRQIPNEQEFSKLSEVFAEQKLITQTEYKIAESKERVDRDGIVWQVVMASCELTIIDVESDEEITYIAFGAGFDKGVMAIVMAQNVALSRAWMDALGITRPIGNVEVGPEIIVETPESKLITHIKALWKWDYALFPDYVSKRFSRPIEQLNITELSVLKSELENYGR